MRIIIIALTIVLFTTSLFAEGGKEKYDKVVSNNRKLLLPTNFLKIQLLTKGINEFLETTSLPKSK